MGQYVGIELPRSRPHPTAINLGGRLIVVALGLIHGPLGDNALYLCIDMQRLFAPGGPWAVPWAEKVLPAIEESVARHPPRTVFTRFIPAKHPGEAPGMWGH